jgi:hypothetical protein
LGWGKGVGLGGLYLKKSEPILLTGSAGGIPPEPPFRTPRQKAEAERTILLFKITLLRKTVKLY